MTMIRTLLTTALIWASCTAVAQAQSSPVVVELFTSQGCSSCPPADAMLHDLAKRDDVLPLALHVDYWDYIGWKDSFALAGHTARQKTYAHEAGRNMIYTPQMIINGADDVVGARAMQLADLIMAHKDKPALARISVQKARGQLKISVWPETPGPTGRYDVVIVRYFALQSVKITRGENAGKYLDYANVVDDWRVAGQWDGQGSLDLAIPLEGSDPAAVLVQQVGTGPIIAAARVE